MSKNNEHCTLIVPTLNAGVTFSQFLKALHQQTLQPDKLILLDSESEDNTVNLASEAGFEIYNVPRCEFNHGGTRKKGTDIDPNAAYYIFLTQDAILTTPTSLSNLLKCFDDKTVGAVYGRQLPHHDASEISHHARIFNYPRASYIKSQSDIPKLGVKSAFISDSFAAYRRTALIDVGGFPPDVILGEDTYVAAKILQRGGKIAYCAEAEVYHSHNYSYLEELRRYFDTGVFHSREKWFLDYLGNAEGEGKRFIYSELKYLLKRAPLLIPSALLRTIFKYLGYKLGMLESKIPVKLKRKLSMNRGYWK